MTHAATVDCPAASLPEISDRLTLRQFWELHYLPHCIEDPTSRNVESYLRALDLWEALTLDRPLGEITSGELSDFKGRLAEIRFRGRPLAVNTIRKHLDHVQWMLDQAGPPGPRQLRTAVGVIPTVPYTKPPKRRKSFRRQTPAAHIVALYHACEHARLPRVDGVKPSALWQALLATMCSTSLRIGQLVSTPMDAVKWDEGLLILPAHVCRKSKTEEPKPLHPFALQRLLAIRGTRERLFPFWPRPHSKRTIYLELHRLQTLAGVPHFAFHGMRRYVLTYLSQLSPAAAQLAAGHSSYETTKIYQDLELLETAVNQMTLFDDLRSGNG